MATIAQTTAAQIEALRKVAAQATTTGTALDASQSQQQATIARIDEAMRKLQAQADRIEAMLPKLESAAEKAREVNSTLIEASNIARRLASQATIHAPPGSLGSKPGAQAAQEQTFLLEILRELGSAGRVAS